MKARDYEYDDMGEETWKFEVIIIFSKNYSMYNTGERSEPETRAPRGTDRSPEYNEYFCYKLDSRVKKLTMKWNHQKTTTLHNTCF